MPPPVRSAPLHRDIRSPDIDGDTGDLRTGRQEAEIIVGFPGPDGDEPVGSGDVTARPAGELHAVDADVAEERRRFIRVSKPINFQLRYLDRPLAADMVDISEGGLRCVVAADQEFDPEELVRARVDLGDGDLEVKGTVSWRRMTDGTTELGVRFMELTESEAQQIRSHVFALQLQERRAERSRHDQHHRHHHGPHGGRRH